MWRVSALRCTACRFGDCNQNKTEQNDSVFYRKYKEHLCEQYKEANVMHFSFNLLRIMGLYMFRALLAPPQEALHKRHLVYCVRIMSVGCATATYKLLKFVVGPSGQAVRSSDKRQYSGCLTHLAGKHRDTTVHLASKHRVTTVHLASKHSSRAKLKRDGPCAETRIRLSEKRTSPFESACVSA
jgi:hypothetical protein